MSLKIPPPVVALLACLGMWLLARFFTAASLPTPVTGYAAMGVAIVGLAIELVSVALFFRSRTTINPLTPERSKKLVVSGMYRLSRNPMYLGLFLLLCGFALWLSNFVSPVMLVLFVWYITTFQIKPEEAALLNRFGDDYRAYRQRVRRWI